MKHTLKWRIQAYFAIKYLAVQNHSSKFLVHRKDFLSTRLREAGKGCTAAFSGTIEFQTHPSLITLLPHFQMGQEQYSLFCSSIGL